MNRLLRALMMLVVLGSLVVAGVSHYLVNEIRRPLDPEAVEPVEFEILPGQSAAEIASSLKEQGLIKQPMLFNVMLREREAAEQLKVGVFQLSPSMTMGQIISALQVAPTFEEKEFQTIEGMRLEEIGQVLVDAELVPSLEEFMAVATNAEPFKPNHARLESIPTKEQGYERGLEGYLFPAKYRVRATATITEVIETILTDGFDANYASFENEIMVENRSVHDIVTMASIVQREAANVEEMAHLSYIFWNRLKAENLAESGGLIGADPTVQYIAGYSEEQKTWWRNNLTQADLDIDSPYNTRKKQGLPPGPIANPGLAALRAAARPGPQRPDGSEGKDDLYFVAICGQKAHQYARTLEEFSGMQQAYQDCPEQ